MKRSTFFIVIGTIMVLLGGLIYDNNVIRKQVEFMEQCQSIFDSQHRQIVEWKRKYDSVITSHDSIVVFDGQWHTEPITHPVGHSPKN